MKFTGEFRPYATEIYLNISICGYANVYLNLKCLPVMCKPGSFMAKFQDSYPPHNCTKMSLTGSPQ